MNDPRHTHTPAPDHRVRQTLLSVGLIASLAFALSSSLPLPVIPAAMNSLLFLAALGTMAVAALRRENPRDPDRLNGWDQSLILLLLAIGSGFLVDHHAVTQFVEAARTGAAGA